MQLIRALLVAAATTVVLSGIAVFFGSSRQERKPARYFLISAFGAALWTVAIFVALDMPWASADFVHFIMACTIGSIALCDIGLLAFLSHGYKGGRILTLLFTIGAAILITLLAYDSSLFYSSYDLSHGYVHFSVDRSCWYFYALIIYFFLISITFSSYLLRRIEETKNPGLKKGLRVFLAGLSIGGILALVFNLLLLTSLPEFVWIGPLATVISIVSFYFSVAKFGTLNVSSKYMKAMSGVILVGIAVIVYLTAFYVVSSIAK